ncbi:hypothetical protein FNV43_RR00608 [Rhamnella rubrinervis]|uniref:Uncharacterized protein n=1 Tax=Rhamnella rubrinervis TaxID=2594499 RepID=A0A8K0HNZ5_9ROSA|nr:hypothetical protein FNV43_RR00608 [Rhamnella rubrinervis]
MFYHHGRPDINAAFMREEAQGKETIVAGFYHEGYEEPLLMLMKRRAVHSGLVVKVADSISGFEGTTSRKSKLGRDSTNGINTIFEAEQQPHSATKSWKRKRKSLVPGKLTLPQSKLGQDSTTDINTNFGSEQQPQPASKAWKRKRRTLVLKPIWILILANLQSLRYIGRYSYVYTFLLCLLRNVFAVCDIYCDCIWDWSMFFLKCWHRHVYGYSLTAAKPGTGMVIAVKRLNQEGFQAFFLERTLEGCSWCYKGACFASQCKENEFWLPGGATWLAL